MWSLKNNTNELFAKQKWTMNIENKLMVTRGREGRAKLAWD